MFPRVDEPQSGCQDSNLASAYTPSTSGLKQTQKPGPPPGPHHPSNQQPLVFRGFPTHHLRTPNVNKNKSANLLSDVVDPTTTQEKKSTAHASARLAINVLGRSSDAFTPLKSAAERLDTSNLRYFHVRFTYCFQTILPLTCYITSNRWRTVKG